MRVYVECPICCYAVSGDEYKALVRVEDHMDSEHPNASQQPIVSELEDEGM